MTNLPLACAGAKVRCPDCKGTGYDCWTCLERGPGAGLVYVLPEAVRVPCIAAKHSPCEIDRGGSTYEIEVLPDCHGLRWTPAANGWVWWRAIDAIDPEYLEFNAEVIIEMWQDQWGPEESDPEAAFFQALHQALEAMGATFEEVEDGHV